jgi:hypothetical protein
VNFICKGIHKKFFFKKIAGIKKVVKLPHCGSSTAHGRGLGQPSAQAATIYGQPGKGAALTGVGLSLPSGLTRGSHFRFFLL